MRTRISLDITLNRCGKDKKCVYGPLSHAPYIVKVVKVQLCSLRVSTIWQMSAKVECSLCANVESGPCANVERGPRANVECGP